MLMYLMLMYDPRLPMKEGLLDWDCPEAIDIPAMAEALSYIRQNASFPVLTTDSLMQGHN